MGTTNGCITQENIFANLFNISKQTLLYYDKIKLLSPAYVDDKGYRQYSIQQYLDLEIIVNLHSFNISIMVIREYLQQRSKDDFLKLVAIKKKECKGVTAKGIIVTTLAGDCFPAPPIGINLPNADWIRKDYGSKSVTITNLMEAYDKAAAESPKSVLAEFAYSQ